jgi:acetone carboxylase gamma subunit
MCPFKNKQNYDDSTQDSQELLYQIRHSEWDLVRADILTSVFKQEDEYFNYLTKYQDAYDYNKIIINMRNYLNEVWNDV